MRKFAIGLAAVLGGLALTPALAQQPPAAQGFVAGKPLPVRDNVRTFGSFCRAESVTYDADRDLYIVVSPCIPNNLQPNDGYISLVNPDGTVHTLKWIMATQDNGLELNDPRGSDMAGGILAVADIDTVRTFDAATGEPRNAYKIDGAMLLNDVEIDEDGTIYVTDTATNDNLAGAAIYKISPSGEISTFAMGEDLARPNGIAIDNDGNIVTVAIGNDEVRTYSPDGQVIKIEHNISPRNDGLVILSDGTKITSNLQDNQLVRIPPGKPAETIIDQIFTPASIAYDSKRNRIVVPENQQNAITIVDLP